jgi:thymidine phosphorylase
VDPAAGVVLLVKPGDKVEIGDPVANLHHNGTGDDAARGILTGAFSISRMADVTEECVIERL